MAGAETAGGLCRIAAATVYRSLDCDKWTYATWGFALAADDFRRAAALASCCADRIRLLDFACRAAAGAAEDGDEAARRLCNEAFGFAPPPSLREYD